MRRPAISGRFWNFQWLKLFELGVTIIISTLPLDGQFRGLDSDEFRFEFQPNFFMPAFFAAFCKSSSSVASGIPSLKASSR